MVVGVLLALGAICCGKASTGSPNRLEGSMLEIELDVFSGRPNPRWQPDAATRANIVALLKGDHPAAATPQPPGLGYRGFVLHLDGRAIHVYDDIASGLHPDPVRVAGLEKLLATSAAQAGHAALLPAT
jgi:hypothetical protein